MGENFEIYEVKHKGKIFVLFLYPASLVKRLKVVKKTKHQNF